MYSKAFVPAFIFLFFSFWGSAQECTIGVGGKNPETLIKVFQLNEEQVGKMETLGAALQIETKTVEDAVQKLFAEHPQSTPKELTTLAEKYRVLQDKIVKASLEADKEMLSTFNEKQYERYLSLCNEAMRRPIQVLPVTLGDSLVDPE